MSWRDEALRLGVDQNNPSALAAAGIVPDYSSSGGGGGSVNYPPFNFDWTAARNDALAELTPYYEQKLKDAKGDVELAKKYIEEDYQKGIRISREDYEREIRTTNEDLTTQTAEDTLTRTQETREARAGANRRGTYVGQIQPGAETSAAPESSFYQEYIGKPLSEKQRLRKLAIERAITRQQEVAGVTKQRDDESYTTERERGLTAQNIQYPRTQAELEEEKREKAFNVVAPMKYQEALTKYRAANSIPS